MVAEVIINSIVKDLNRVFDYTIPKELENDVAVGARVCVPFGRGEKQEDGFIIALKEKSDFKTKEILKIENKYLTEQNMNLAKLMSKRYFCNISDCIKVMLPPGTLNKNISNRVKDKKGNFVYLKDEIEELENQIEDGIIKSEKQIRVLNFLKVNEGIHITDLELLTDVSKAIIKTLEKNGRIEIIEEQIKRNPFKNKNIKKDKPYKLTEEQKYAFERIREVIDSEEFSEFLLYGVTGSGKTEVYLQLIEQVLKKQKTAIMLVPEISLTPQMVNRFVARFGEEKIAVLHSKLSIGERYDEWHRIYAGEARIVIGARSAIFAPVKNLGILIIDEEHDSSYKSDMPPKFNAKEIARYLCKQNQAPLILGSATPDINTFYKTNNNIELLRLTKRANQSNLPDVKIIDLREELAYGNKTMFSAELYTKIQENIKNNHQTILFLNRRGYSTFVMCMDCGYTLKCKNCNISLTYHRKENKLRCHYCGFEVSPITTCPNCKSQKIKYLGTGTQKLEEELQKMFPQISTIRMDIDTVTKKNSHEDILRKFNDENINVLIGTQMIVKGHHFPNVTLVGVIIADSSLNIDDYRANERTFQILTQVAGRAGRENLPGQVIIQTYNPDNYSILYAQEQDYDKFYQTEINIRKQLKYPPFCDIILINISSKDENEIQMVIQFLYKELTNKEISKKMIVYKPLPAPIDKIKNKIRWRIIIKCKFDNTIIDLLNNTLDKFYKTNYKKTSVIVDVNPTNMM